MSGSYYDILGVSIGATQRDIKVAYRKLVQAHHPDINNSGSDEMIKSINIAYETLSNPTKRAQYDRRPQGSYQPQTSSTYNTPYRPKPRRRPPPHSFYRYQAKSDTTYIYSTKTKLQGLAAVVLAIITIYAGIRGMNYYASTYYFEEGQQAEANENYAKAFSSYRLAIRDWGSKNVEATIRMIELNRRSDNYLSMLEKIEMGFTYNPDSTEAGLLYYLQGIGYAHTNRYSEAVKAYINSLKFNFNKDSIYTQLGPIYLNQMQQYNEASKIYSYLLLDEVNTTEDYYNRAVSYQYLGKHTLALADLLTILKDDPYNGKILFQLGRSYLALGQQDKACEYLRFAKKQGININPKDFAKACD